MGGTEQLVQGVLLLAQNVDRAFTFVLLIVRFSTLLLLLPGMGSSARNLVVKYPFIILLAFSASFSSPIAKMPEDLAVLVGMFISEAMLGICLGAIPIIIIACVQTAGQLASTSMGLQAAAVMDPTSGTTISEVSRILGDTCIIAFILVGGPHIMIYAASGLGGTVMPGTFLIGESTIDLMVSSTAAVFKYGILFSSPVIVALLLTNFVMGLISKSVPTVNIFIISYPLTIGIGLILTMLMLPEILRAIEPLLTSLDNSIFTVFKDVQTIS